MTVIFEVYDECGVFDRYLEINNLASFSCSHIGKGLVYHFSPKVGTSWSLKGDKVLIYHIDEDDD